MAKPTYFQLTPGSEFRREEYDSWREMAHCDEDEQNDGVLSFRNILKLINDVGTGTTIQEKLYSLRQDIINAWKVEPSGEPEKDSDGRVLSLDENGKVVVLKGGVYYYVDEDSNEATSEKYIGDKQKLRTWYSGTEADESVKFKSSIAKKVYYSKFDVDNVTNDKNNAQANVLMMLDEQALAFFEEHEKDSNFDEIWSSFVANNFPNLSYRLANNRCEKSLRDKGVTTSYSLDNNGHLKCTYENLGSKENGLTVTIVDNRLSVLTQGDEIKPLTKITAQQYNDLVDLLKSRGSEIEISDETLESLKNIMVVTDDGIPCKANPNDKNSSADLYSHLQRAEFIKAKEYTLTGYGHEDVPHEDVPQNNTPENQETDYTSSSFSGSEPDNKPQSDNVEFNTYQFLKSTGKKESYKNIRNKFVSEFNREHIDHTIDVHYGIGGFEIACWGSDEDKYNDGKIDTKTGIKKETKLFGCKFRYGPPPSATLTAGNLKKLTKTDAQAIFKAMKKAGALYVKIPGKSEVGSAAFKNMLQATISAGLVPTLGNSDTNPLASTGIGYGEIKDIYDELMKSGRKVEEKVAYSLRISEQIRFHNKECPKDQIGDYGDFFLAYARFGHFKDLCYNSLTLFVGLKTKAIAFDKDGKPFLSDTVVDLSEENGKNGVTSVDRICAKHAMTQIINDLTKGRIPKVDENGNLVKSADGKIQYEAYDPVKTDNIQEKFQRVMSAYMVDVKLDVYNEIETKYKNYEEERKKSNTTGDTTNSQKAVRDVAEVYENKYAEALENARRVDVKIEKHSNFEYVKANLGYVTPEKRGGELNIAAQKKQVSNVN